MILNQPIDEIEKTVVIIGVQRGGTSMVAGVVRELGVDLGKNLGKNHEDPRFLTKDIKNILTVVENRNKEMEVWGWKMPHTSEYIAELHQKLRNPHIVIVFRNILAIAESQMKRSGAEFEVGLQVSKSRQNELVDVISELKCPLMLVNYDDAIRKPEKFVNEIIYFLNISAELEQVEGALRMIDPETGYQRIRSEEWCYSVDHIQESEFRKLPRARCQIRLVALYREGNQLKRLKDRAYIELNKIGEHNVSEMKLGLFRAGPSEKVKVIVNVGSGFSYNMHENIEVKGGRNIITFKAPKIAGIRVFPVFEIGGDGEEVSNIKLFEVIEGGAN